MGVEVTASGRGGETLLLDLVEGWNGFHNAVAGNPNGQLSDARTSTELAAGSLSSSQLFPTVSGAVGPLAFDANIGRTGHVWTAQAAITSIGGQTGIGSFGIPIGQKFSPSLVVPLPVALFPRPFRRYRLDYLLRGIITPVAAADVACGIVSNNPSAQVTGGAADPFVAWVSRSGLFGGRWAPRWRLTAGGAFVDGPDSGIPFIPAPLALYQLSIVYEEGITPRIRFLHNNREVHQLAGDAAMITANGVCVPAKTIGAGAGNSQVQYCETRFRVWEI